MAHKTVVDIEVRTTAPDGNPLDVWEPDFLESLRQATERCEIEGRVLGLNRHAHPIQLVKSEVKWIDDPKAVLRFTFLTVTPGDRR